MNFATLRALEFDRIVPVVADLAVTPTGRAELMSLAPLTDAAGVGALQRATTEGKRFLAAHRGFPLRAPSDLETVLEALEVEARPLEPLHLLALAVYLESIEQTRAALTTVRDAFPILAALAQAAASFKAEIADVRRKIDPSGDLVDEASPALSSIRDRLRKQRARLRATLEGYVRGRDTAKYLQDQVVTDRNGRYVLVLRAEHRSAIPGIVHGTSTSGASLFLEPLPTVEVNNEIVALQQQEADEVHRILLALTDAFRERSEDLRSTLDVATGLDIVQARARFSEIVDGTEARLSTDGAVELRSARHPLLLARVRERLRSEAELESDDTGPVNGVSSPSDPVPIDILLVPSTHVLIITGPNTGGKTVALKTAGLLAAMAQAGLHIPAHPESRLPVFQTLFADIGDEQSISASLSTFSAHITNVVSMYRDLALPALVLLDEVGAGTDPVEGGALGIAVIDRFRHRGAHLIATTHYDSLKSYASTTEGVTSAAFGFDPDTFAPTYRLVYGSPGRSLAIEIAGRLGMPPEVVSAARLNLTDREKQLAEHLMKVDRDLRALEKERELVVRERAAVANAENQLRAREESLRSKEEQYRRRLDAKLDDQVKAARREIDVVLEGLKARMAQLSEEAARRSAPRLNTGDTGAMRAQARSALDAVARSVKSTAETLASGNPAVQATEAALGPGVRVAIGTLGLEGTIVALHEKHADIDVRGKRLRAARRDLRVIGPPAPTASVKVRVDLQPREALSSELNVIGCTVDEALTRAEKFLDEATITDQRTVRIIHGHGTGQLRRAIEGFLKSHSLVTRFEAAPQNQGGGGATIAYLKE